ncbi:MAG: hypothetical protein ACRDVG_09890 [Jatrophihabitantaceae bacterium]
MPGEWVQHGAVAEAGMSTALGDTVITRFNTRADGAPDQRRTRPPARGSHGSS